jgi:hypothetical protein
MVRCAACAAYSQLEPGNEPPALVTGGASGIGLNDAGPQRRQGGQARRVLHRYEPTERHAPQRIVGKRSSDPMAMAA